MFTTTMSPNNTLCLESRIKMLVCFREFRELKQLKCYLLIVAIITIIMILPLILYKLCTSRFTEIKLIINKYLFMNGNLEYKSEWISLVGYISMCDVAENIEYSGIFDDGSSVIHNRNRFKNIKNGDLICLTGDQLTNDFLPNILPLYENTNIYFIIFTWIRPRSFPLELEINRLEFANKLLLNKHILHIYCIDYDGSFDSMIIHHNKLSAIPIGIDYHNKLYKFRKYGIPQHPLKQELTINKYINHSLLKQNYMKREIKIFRDDMSNKKILEWNKKTNIFNKFNKSIINLYINDNIDFIDNHVLRRNIVRWNAYYKINKSLIYNEMNRKSQKEIFIERSKYVFILSPFGGGIDCYRMWEALIFGHIVITQNSPLNKLYDGLPVIIVNDWNEINQNKLEFWYEKYFFNQTAQNNKKVRQKLTTKYWIQYMKHLKNIKKTI